MLFRSQDVSTLVVVVVGCDLHNFMSKYVGQYKNGQMHGDGTFTFKSGNKYEG